MIDTESFEIRSVRPIWCRFDGKCWSESDCKDYDVFRSDPANRVSVFSVDCAVVVRYFVNCDRDNYFDIKILGIIVSVKFHDFVDDYEIETNVRNVKCEFGGGNKWRYENDSFSFDTFGEMELRKEIRRDADVLNAATYIKDEVEYHLGYKDDGKLADEITDSIVSVVVDKLENF